jgi:hypothetical protein
MTARAAPYFPKTFTGDAVTKDFTLGFPFLAAAHLRVTVGGVLKTLDTDYYVMDPTSADASFIRFVTAPAASANNIKVYRNTPIEKYRDNPTIGNVDGLQAFYRRQEREDQRVMLDGYINATDLAAGTASSVVAPCDGYIEKLETDVVDAAVGTGGNVTVEVDGVAVTGLVIAVADSAAIGIHQEDTPTTAQSATTKVKKGQTITVTPAAAFATSGALLWRIQLQPADLT